MPTGESGVATDLAAFVASLSDDDVPDDVLACDDALPPVDSASTSGTAPASDGPTIRASTIEIPTRRDQPSTLPHCGVRASINPIKENCGVIASTGSRRAAI